MNIQMILSALPASHSGTSQPGAESGQFALALGQATQVTSADSAHAHAHATPPGAALAEGLPSSLAAPEALLQALHAAGYALNGNHESGESDARLDEIMARLALITADHGQALPDDATSPALPLPDAIGADDNATAVEADGMPQVLAATVVAIEPQQPGTTAIGVQDERHGTPGQSAALHAAAIPATPLGNAPGPAVASETTRPGASELAVTTTLTRIGTAQPAGELSHLNTEAPRGSFMPEATTTTAITSTASGQGNSAAQPALPAQTLLTAPVQSQTWSTQLGQQLVQFARQGGEQRIEMRLNPAELGPLSVTLKMTEQGAQAQFLSAHASVRQVLEQAIPQLREALAEQGITLGETSVGEQRQQNAHAFADSHTGQGQHGAAGEADTHLADSEPLPSDTSTTASLDGRVDLYA